MPKEDERAFFNNLKADGSFDWEANWTNKAVGAMTEQALRDLNSRLKAIEAALLPPAAK